MMKRPAVLIAALLLLSSCGPENPFDPDPGTVALTATSPAPNTAKLTWTPSPDGDFYSYTLFRSSSPEIRFNPSAATVVFETLNKGTTTFTDTGLAEGTWYYVLKVTNEAGNFSWSNEVSIKAAGKFVK
jgi:hypothetical protein